MEKYMEKNVYDADKAEIIEVSAGDTGCNGICW